MNIDALINSISEKTLKDSISRWVDKWKKDEQSIHELYDLLNQWHGNARFQNHDEQNTFYRNLNKFKHDAIDGIGGMSLNERLYMFGLLEQWDSSNDAERLVIRTKLHAPI
jgi:intergrase/recombinase